jgi:hypothetical protein
MKKLTIMSILIILTGFYAMTSNAEQIIYCPKVICTSNNWRDCSPDPNDANSRYFEKGSLKDYPLSSTEMNFRYAYTNQKINAAASGTTMCYYGRDNMSLYANPCMGNNYYADLQLQQHNWKLSPRNLPSLMCLSDDRDNCPIHILS